MIKNESIQIMKLIYKFIQTIGFILQLERSSYSV